MWSAADKCKLHTYSCLITSFKAKWMPSQGDLHPQSLGSVRVQQPPAPQHPWAPVLPMMAPRSLGRPPHQVSLHCMCPITFCVSSATRLLHRSIPAAILWMSFAHAVLQRHDHAVEILTAGHLVQIVLALQNLQLEAPFAVLLPGPALLRLRRLLCRLHRTGNQQRSGEQSAALGGARRLTVRDQHLLWRRWEQLIWGLWLRCASGLYPLFLTDNFWRHPVVACFDQELTEVHTTSTELQVAFCY